MQDLSKALTDIAALRSQFARSSEFRGYGPTTLSATGAIAAMAAVIQAIYLPNPAETPMSYLAIWVATAALSVVLIGIEVVTRSHRVHSSLANEMLHMAIEQLLPAVAAGVLLTCVVVRSAPQVVWMLPGLWQICMSLGVFASARSLSRPMMLVGGWYMVTGLVCIAWANGDNAFSPLSMGVPFTTGQLFAAALLQYVGKFDEEA